MLTQAEIESVVKAGLDAICRRGYGGYCPRHKLGKVDLRVCATCPDHEPESREIAQALAERMKER